MSAGQTTEPTGRPIPVLVVGAGSAGLATSWHLKAQGLEHRVLEQGGSIGYRWTRVYDSLKLHTGKHMSGLPGMPLSRTTPLFPPRADFLRYLHDYAERFDVPAELNTRVESAEHQGDSWRLATNRGVMLSKHLVIATGIMSNPYVPPIVCMDLYQGDLLHTAQYRSPERFLSRRVLVVGVGNSGADVAAELGRAGCQISISVRSGAHVVPLTTLGIPVQYYARAMERLPKRARRAITSTFTATMGRLHGPAVLPRPPYGILDRPPVVGFGLVRAIEAGQVSLQADVHNFTASGAAFIDGTEQAYEAVILATGYRPALSLLGDQIRRDARGFAERDQVVSRDRSNLYFVGQNYSAIGALVNIARDSALTAAIIRAAVSGGNEPMKPVPTGTA